MIIKDRDDSKCTEIVFTQNTREEVRDLKNCSGCIGAQSGSHQTNYIARHGDGTMEEKQEAMTEERWKALKKRMQELGTEKVWEIMHENGIDLEVRRLTPLECERLMGFPDGYTAVDEKSPDSHRYKACGNSWCVNCAEWVGMRINMEEETKEHKCQKEF